MYNWMFTLDAVCVLVTKPWWWEKVNENHCQQGGDGWIIKNIYTERRIMEIYKADKTWKHWWGRNYTDWQQSWIRASLYWKFAVWKLKLKHRRGSSSNKLKLVVSWIITGQKHQRITYMLMTRRSIALLMLSHWMKFLDHLTIVFQTFDHGWLLTNSKLMTVRLNSFSSHHLGQNSPKIFKLLLVSLILVHLPHVRAWVLCLMTIFPWMPISATYAVLLIFTSGTLEHTWSSHSICPSPAGAFSCHLTCRLLQCSASWGTRLQNQTPTENA